MSNNIVIKYLKSCYCIEDVSDIDAEDHLLDTYRKQPLTIERCRVLLKLLHEQTHLIQDISCFSSYVEDRIQQVLLSYLTYLPHQADITFPLYSRNNRTNEVPERKKGVEVRMVDGQLYYLYYYHDFKEVLFRKGKFPTIEADLFRTSKGVIKEFSISYRDLLESHAHFKSIFDLYVLTSESPYKGTVHQLIAKDNLFPFSNTGKGRVGINILPFKYQKTYYYPFYLFMQATSFNWGDIMNYLNTYFPIQGIKGHDEYLKSYFLFTLIFEAAVCIPSFDDILYKSKTKNFKFDYFNPVTRFAQILNFFAKFSHDELMEYKTGDLKSLIDTLSKEYGWPDFETTIRSHSFGDDTLVNMVTCDSLEIIQRIGRDSIKMKSECNANFTWVSLALNELNVPTISRTSKGLRQFCKGNWPKDVTDRYQSFYDAWYGNDLDGTHREYRQFLKLISEKLFRTTILDTDLYFGGEYNCPMKASECPHRCEFCNSIKHIQDIKEFTSNNGIKCMFSDYLNSKEFITPISRTLSDF